MINGSFLLCKAALCAGVFCALSLAASEEAGKTQKPKTSVVSAPEKASESVLQCSCGSCDKCRYRKLQDQYDFIGIAASVYNRRYSKL